jgi:hypothetical protein
MSNAGAVYVFVRSAATWMQTHYVKSSQTMSVDYFGSSLSTDGTSLVIGVPGQAASQAFVVDL